MARNGLISSTGSGKSTTVDLLMGLLAPSTGRVLIDGIDLHESGHPERLAARGRRLPMCRKASTWLTARLQRT